MESKIGYDIPSYLSGHESLWQRDPRTANIEWFRNARFGLFIHYGLYSQLGRGEWVQFRDKIPVGVYESLKDNFRADKFDADFITDLACEAQMKYITMVTCHHDSFCLWNSRNEPFNSINSPCGRDLVGEMAECCRKKKLGFFTYYTYLLNWRHPKFMSRDYFFCARPDYATPEPRYTFNVPDDFKEYVGYVHASLAELLSGYGAIAGVWLDIIMGYYAQPDMMPVRSTYNMIRKMQPHALIAFKQGATGDEDFATPERQFHSLADRARELFGDKAAKIAEEAWQRNRNKHNEICATLQEGTWGYSSTARHIVADEVWKMLGNASFHNCNLLLNIGPLPDGSVHPEDISTLKEIGRRIREHGWPEPVSV